MKKGIDVTSEYLKASTPNQGMFIMENGYVTSDHETEIAMAKWLHNQFGGNMILLSETGDVYLGKRADYLWRDKLWELKSTGTSKSADNALRKALQQIRENPGGVILDLGKSKDSVSRTESVINERIRKSCRFQVDIMIVQHGKLQKVLRYKK